MKNSIKYFFKESLPSICITTIIITAIYCFILSMANLKYSVSIEGSYSYARYPSTYHGTIIAMLEILCAIVPISNFAKYKNKNAVDVYASLPLSKKSFYVQKLITGYIDIFIGFTIPYFAGVFVILIRGSDIDMIQYIPMYFLSILSSIPLYLIFSFFVIKANRVIDSIFYIIFYAVITSAITAAINNIITGGGVPGILYLLGEDSSLDFKNNFQSLLFPFNSLENISSYYSISLLSNLPGIEFSNFSYSLSMLVIAICIQILIGFLALLGISNTINMSKNEDTEERSKTWFGYKTMIPVMYVTTLFSSTIISASSLLEDKMIMFSLFLVMTVIDFLVCMSLTMGLEFKSVKIPKSRWITLTSIFVASILIFFIPR